MTTTPVQAWMTPATASTAPAVAKPAPDTLGTAADPLANKSMFLRLLVEQLKNQDPANPADGTQFVTQLAQFSSLEATTVMRDDLDAIRASLAALTTLPPAAPTANSAAVPAQAAATPITTTT
jgi:flagellar basal-body rod modification protein FlgD